jgi:glycosyltransferase involved in cell wall biosynthesis
MAACKWQVEAGHRVSVIHGADYDPFWYGAPVPGVDLIAVPEMVHAVKPVQDLRALRRLRALYAHLQPDVIHTHQSKAGILGRLAAGAVPDAVVAHGIHIVPFDEVSPRKRALYIAAEKLAARRTDVFIGVSEAVSQAYVSAGIARRGKVHCVRSGMDVERFRYGTLPGDWRALLGVAQGNARPRVALMMAAFEPRKRHVAFLTAFARVADTLPDLKLLLAGAGPEEARVRAAVAELGLGERVVFCGHRADPEALMALADVTVLSSMREGLPRVVVQSLAAGRPVILNDLPGIGEIVTSGRNGIITPAGDMAATVGALQTVLNDTARLKALQQGAAATDVGDWAVDFFGARTTALYGLPVRRAAPIGDLADHLVGA